MEAINSIKMEDKVNKINSRNDKTPLIFKKTKICINLQVKINHFNNKTRMLPLK